MREASEGMNQHFPKGMQILGFAWLRTILPLEKARTCARRKKLEIFGHVPLV